MTPISIISRRCGVVLILVLLPLACSDKDGPLVPVHGKVYYRGVLLRFGSIVFTPDLDRGGHGPLSRAEIQPDGGYTLKTGGETGAVAGWHRVTIVAVEPAAAERAQQGAARELGPLLPRRYSDPGMSGLSCQVKPGEANVFDFHLD